MVRGGSTLQAAGLEMGPWVRGAQHWPWRDAPEEVGLRSGPLGAGDHWEGGAMPGPPGLAQSLPGCLAFTCFDLSGPQSL